MIVTAARLVMRLATRSLGAQHRQWAQAMHAELSAAEADGRPLGFALGCLIAAWRIMPAHAEGRFTLMSYLLSLGLIVPTAGLLLLASVFGFPFVDSGQGFVGSVSGHGTRELLLNAGNVALAPALSLAMLLLAACHLPFAWWMLDRDWDRVATALRLAAAALTTLALVSALAALDLDQLLPPAVVLAFEILALSAVARWHERLFCNDTSEEYGAAL